MILQKNSDGHQADMIIERGSIPLGSAKGYLRVGDKKQMLEYYEEAFEEFQQLNCRLLAKAIIKVIQPLKKSKYPYNGQVMPPWWPRRVPHKEPDHMRKAGMENPGLRYQMKLLTPHNKTGFPSSSTFCVDRSLWNSLGK
jgi:Protein of unknown function (DUF2841).